MVQLRLTVLVLCATLFVAAQAAKGPKPSAVPYFAHWLVDAKSGKLAQAQAKGGLSVAAATAEEKEEYYEHSYYADSKHVCLQEQRQRDCRYFGCQNWIESCGGGACENCHVGDFFTSDFTCCKEEYYYGYSYKTNNLFLPKNSVGSCDWTIFWFRQDNTAGTGTGCGWIDVVTGVTYKIGTAYGTCYFNAESEYCGEPLCDRMVMSVQGDVYATQAYSHDPPTTISQDENCITWGSIGDGCAGKKALPAFAPGAAKAPAADATKPAAGATKPVAAPAAKGGLKVQYEEHTETIYRGEAVIISGTIDSINGQKHETKYDDGLFEYVPYFTGFPTDDGVDPNIPWVKGNSYKLEFWKDGAKYYSK